MTALDDIENWVRSAGHSGVTAEACYDLCPDMSHGKIQDVLQRLRQQRKIWRRFGVRGEGEQGHYSYIHRDFSRVLSWQRW